MEKPEIKVEVIKAPIEEIGRNLTTISPNEIVIENTVMAEFEGAFMSIKVKKTVVLIDESGMFGQSDDKVRVRSEIRKTLEVS